MIGEEAFSGTGLGTGTVYCEPESYADNAAHYPDGTTIRYRRAVAVTAAPRFAVKGVIGGREVTFSCDTKDAVIYYSLTSSNLTTGDKAVQNGETVTFENFYGTVYAKAYANGQWSNVARLVLKIPVVNTPVITQSGSQVSIRTTTPNSMIYYTTDGSVPSPGHGRRAASPCSFTMAKTATVKAVAVRSCFTNSTVAEKTITLSPGNGLGAPAFKVKGVVGGRNVTFTSTTPGAVIYYSTSKSAVTTKDKSVKSGESVLFENFYGTVYAKTYSDGYWSNVSRLILKIPVVNQPTVTRASANGYVNISTTTPGCTLYYTTDGSTPSPNHGTRISSSTGRAAVGKGATIKVIAVRSCFTNSKVISFKY